jgi:hypothetical protein
VHESDGKAHLVVRAQTKVRLLRSAGGGERAVDADAVTGLDLKRSVVAERNNNRFDINITFRQF